MHRSLMMNVYLKQIALLTLFFSSTSLLSDELKEKEIHFGIVPFVSPLALAKRMAPLRDYISEELNKKVYIETASSPQEFNARTLSDHYDLILTNPVFAFRSLQGGKTDAIAIQAKSIVGQLIVLKDSPIETVNDLVKFKVGVPPKEGIIAKALPALFAKAGIDKEMNKNIKYFHSHNSALSALKTGRVDAVLTSNFFLSKHPNFNDNYRTLTKTEDMPGLTVLTSKKMRSDLKEELKEIFIGMHKNKRGRKILKQAAIPPFKEMNEGELDIIKGFLTN